MSKDQINIAIDGHSACGKSTTSKQVAKDLGYKYIDTGAMYRAVTLYILDNEIDIGDGLVNDEVLNDIQIDFKVDEELGNRTILNGCDVEKAIRSMRVSEKVSQVSTISAVRRKLVEQQQKIAGQKGIVMDGRDIGTVVLPNAELKIFMTANIQARTQRRWLELKSKGIQLSLEEVQANLEHRDHTDSNRTDSPLKRAEDALLLDTSNMTLAQQKQWILEKIEILLHPQQY